MQHVQDPVEPHSIGDRLAPWLAAPSRPHRDQRLELGPQLVVDVESETARPRPQILDDTADGFEAKER